MVAAGSLTESPNTSVLSLASSSRSDEIAALSREAIEALDETGMATVVRDSGLPFLRDRDFDRLSMQDHTTLKRLTFLAREYCRNRWSNQRGSALSE